MPVRQLWLAFGLLAAAPACAGEISGTYVGKGSGSAFLAQVVETTGGQLTGRYERTVLDAAGRLSQMNASISGASDGKTVVVTIKPTEIFSAPITASGTFDGSQLHLSGGGNGSKIELNLSKGDEAAYRREIADLTNEAGRIRKARAQADLLSRLNKLADNMLKYSNEADAQLPKFPPVEQHYRTITNLMDSALARERSIYGDGQASVARGQISVAINQAGIEAEQLHTGLQSADGEIGEKIQHLAMDAAGLAAGCHSADTARNSDLRIACSKFDDAGVKLKASIAVLAEAFRHAEQIWIEEHRKQQGIIHASDVASR